jgi:hypothetical protein
MPKIRDPRRPEIMLWLSTLEGEERVTMLLAMKYAFRYLEHDREWAKLIERACDEVNPTPQQNEGIITRAGKVAANIKKELEAA